jgi:hypothetical protein
MSLLLVVKSYQGTVAHWYDTASTNINRRQALCGEQARGRSKWMQWRDQSTEGKNVCAQCAKIKAAKEGLDKLGLVEVKRED